MEKGYITLKEATKYCSYSQDYLKLRARQGKLKAIKMGRNWFTTREWLEEYKNRLSIRKGRRSEEKISGPRWINFLFISLVLISIIVGTFLLLSFFEPVLEKIIPARVINIERGVK